MDDGRFDFVEVAQGADNLHDNGARLLLRHQLVLLQVEVQVVSFTELQDCTEPVENRRVPGYVRGGKRSTGGAESRQSEFGGICVSIRAFPTRLRSWKDLLVSHVLYVSCSQANSNSTYSKK